MESQSNGSGEVIGALLVGAAIGALLGILFAPDKGSKTRSKLFKGATDMAGDLKSKIQDSVEDLKGKYEGIREEAETAYEDVKKAAKEKVDSVKQEAKATASKA